MSDNMAACACLKPAYDPIHTGDGFTRDRWCCKLCGSEFVRMFWLDKATREADALRAELAKSKNETRLLDDRLQRARDTLAIHIAETYKREHRRQIDDKRIRGLLGLRTAATTDDVCTAIERLNVNRDYADRVSVSEVDALRAERDEARATKDMFKERADAADAECEDLRNQLAGAEIACGQLRDELAKLASYPWNTQPAAEPTAACARIAEYDPEDPRCKHQPTAEPAPDRLCQVRVWDSGDMRTCDKPIPCQDHPAPDRTFERWLEHNQRISVMEISDRHQDDRLAEVERRVAAIVGDIWHVATRVSKLEQREVKP